MVATVAVEGFKGRIQQLGSADTMLFFGWLTRRSGNSDEMQQNGIVRCLRILQVTERNRFRQTDAGVMRIVEEGAVRVS